MRIRHRVRCTWQDHAEFGRHNMGNAVFRVVEIEHTNAIALTAFAHGGDQRRPLGIGVLVATGLGGRCVIERGKGKIWPAYFAIGRLQFLKGVRRVQLMQDMAVDIDKIAAVDAARRHVGVPDFVKKRRGHGLLAAGAAGFDLDQVI